MKQLRLGLLIILLCGVIVGIGVTQDANSESIRIAAGWEGAEAEGFQTVLDLFTEQTGIEVIYEADATLVDSVVTSSFLDDPADIAFLPRPGVVRQLVEGMYIVPLDDPDNPLVDPQLLDETLRPNLIRLGTFDNRVYGMMVTSRSKSTIWYRIDSFETYGLEIPETWDELKAIADTYVDEGLKPFALGGADGWTLTDWFENIFVRMYGRSDYGELFVTGGIDWNSAKVQATLTVMADMLLPYDERLADGTNSILTVTHRDAIRQWLEGDAEMYYEAGFVRSYAEEIFPDLVCNEDYGFFTFPEINPEFGTPLVGGGQLVVVFNDTEAVREFMNFIASEEGATAWVSADAGSIVSPNLKVKSEAYDNECLALEAEQVQNAETFVFDGSDLMSGVFGEYAFFVSLQDFLIDPSAVNQILEYLDDAARKS